MIDAIGFFSQSIYNLWRTQKIIHSMDSKSYRMNHSLHKMLHKLILYIIVCLTYWVDYSVKFIQNDECSIISTAKLCVHGVNTVDYQLII